MAESPAQPVVKKPLWQRPLGWVLGLVGLCVVCGACSAIFSLTPQGQANIAASGATRTVVAQEQAAAAEATRNAPTETPGPTSTPEPPTATPEPTATATPLPPGQSRESAPAPGELITTEDGWEFRIGGITRDAEQRLQAENPFNAAAPAGLEWVVLRVQATYRGNEQTGKLTGNEVRLTGSSGSIYSYQLLAVLQQPFEGEAFKDGSFEGDLAFLVEQGESNLIAIVDTGPSAAWYLAAEPITLPIVAEATPDPGAEEAGKDRAAAATGPVLAGNGMQLWVTDYDGDAAGRLKAVNQFNPDPAPGMKFIMVRVEGQYFGERSTFADSSSMWRVVGDKGSIYTSPFGLLIDDAYDGEVYRYGKLSGWIPFEVPADEGNWVMIYSGAGTEARYLAVPQ